MKVPYTVVIGEKEISSNQLMPRIRQDMGVIAPHPELNFDEFLKTVANEATTRVSKSSL
jgi:threonyl-tRNA synthetase